MSDQLDKYQVMFILDHETTSNQALTMALEHLTTELLENQIKVIQADSSAEAWPIAGTNMDIDCFLISSNMELDKASSRETVKLLRFIKERQAKVPVFLLADRDRTAEAISEQLMELVNEFVWILEDSPVFIAGRVTAAIQRFRRQLLPPLMKAIWEYNTSNHEYSWAARDIREELVLPKVLPEKNSMIFTEKIFSAPIPELSAVPSALCWIIPELLPIAKILPPKFLVPIFVAVLLPALPVPTGPLCKSA